MVFDPSAARASSVLSTNPFYAGSWICYINGIEVPIVGFNVQSGVWQIPQFQIHVVPDPSMQRLGAEDRVQVAVFYLDHWAGELSEYRLLCDGEIIGWSFSNAFNQRTISYSCIAHIHVFQQLFFFFMNTLDDVVAAQNAMVRTQGFTQAGMFYPYSLFHQGLFVSPQQLVAISERNRPQRDTGIRVSDTLLDRQDATDSQAVIKAPYELVYNVVRGIIDSNVPNENRALPMMNFFARHIRKTRFHNRFVRLPLLEEVARVNERRGVFPIFEAARADEALAAMQRQVSARIGNSGSIWDMLRQVLGTVYMEIGMITNPACVITNLAGEIRGLVTASLPTIDQRPPLAPPAADTASPNVRLTEALAQTGNSDANTRGSSSPEHAREVLNAVDAITQGVLNNLVDDFVRQRIVEAQSRFRDASLGASFNGAVQQYTARLQAIIGENAPLQRKLDTEASRQVLVRAGLPVPNAPEAQNQNAGPQEGTDPTLPLRLAQYFVKPQFLFGVAPHCNVIFPSMNPQWGYDENYINQPTRIYVNDSAMGRLLRAQGTNRDFLVHALTVGFPEEADLVMHHRTGSVGGANAPGHAVETGKNLIIWPEEFFKGPISARFDLPSWFQMLQMQANSTSGAGQSPSTGAGTPSGTPPATAGTPQAGTTGPAGATTTRPADTGSPASLGSTVVHAPTPSDAQASEAARNASLGSSVNAAVARRGLADTNAREFLTEVRAFNGVSRLFLRGSSHRFLNIVGGPGATLRFDRFVAPAKTLLSTEATLAQETQNVPGSRPRVLTGPSMARFMISITPFLQEVSPFSAYSGAQLQAIAFAFGFIAYNETGQFRQIRNWNFGNLYEKHSGDAWTVYGSQGRYAGFPAFDTAADGFRTLIAAITRNYSGAVRVLLGQATIEQASRPDNRTRVTALVATFPANQRAEFTRIGIHPDLFYLALGSGGTIYYQGRADPVGFGAHTAKDSNMLGLFRAGAGNTTARVEFTVVPIRSTPALFDPQNERLAHLAFGDPTRARILAAQAVRRLEALRRGGNTAPAILPDDDVREVIVDSDGRTITRSIPARPGDPQDERITCPASAHVQQEQDQQANNADTADQSRNNRFSDLFRLYAQYEFLRQRYEQRNSGVTTAFNPYVVPGFPSVIFDSMTTRNHVVGYVMSVTQTGSANGQGQASLSTQVQNSFGRTLQEFIQDVRNDMRRFCEAVSAAPAEVITEIRRVIQDADQAEGFYSKLFHGGAPSGNRPAGFHLNRSLSYANDSRQQVTDIAFNGLTPDQAEREREVIRARLEREARRANGAATDADHVFEAADAAAAGSGGGFGVAGFSGPQFSVAHNLDPRRELVPRPNSAYERAFDSYDAAMKLNARPICTLAQYIRFFHGGRTLADLILHHEVEDPLNENSYGVLHTPTARLDTTPEGRSTLEPGDQEVRRPAQYYGRIYRLRPGPGTPPTDEQRGYTSSPGATVSAAHAGVPADYAQTRTDWDSILLAYRIKVRNRDAPNT